MPPRRSNCWSAMASARQHRPRPSSPQRNMIGRTWPWLGQLEGLDGTSRDDRDAASDPGSAVRAQQGHVGARGGSRGGSAEYKSSGTAVLVDQTAKDINALDAFV